MYKMQVDIKHGWTVIALVAHNMGVPHFLEQRARFSVVGHLCILNTL